METILVFIACRLDNDLLNTVNDLLDKANEPNNLDIVIYNQDFEEGMWQQSQFPDNVTLINVREDKTRNVTQVRAHAHLYIKPSHKYYLCIDAHTRFDKGWDKIMVDAVDNYDGDCLITCYPKVYTSKDGVDTYSKHNQHMVNVLKSDIHCNYKFRFTAEAIENKGDYYRSLGAGGYHISDIYWLANVGYDPYAGWQFEELDMTLRSYTNGYDVVNYKDTPIYHLYDHSQRKSIKQPTFNFDIDTRERILSKLHKQNSTFLEHKYQLGNKRSIYDWIEEYGYDIFPLI
jgi:hypothetical protein